MAEDRISKPAALRVSRKVERFGRGFVRRGSRNHTIGEPLRMGVARAGFLLHRRQTKPSNTPAWVGHNQNTEIRS